jgi:hypothetical protein
MSYVKVPGESLSEAGVGRRVRCPKAVDIVGLYLAPPEQTLVICVDEKPQIQALERAQGYLRFSDGQTSRGFSNRYKRHGTTTLFGALEVATGRVTTGHYKRRRRSG